jgi:protein-L-isoaspartate(D-aspartate) O-methyltransferase
VPEQLVEQLRDGGRMVIPVGQRYQQTMYLLRKTNGKLENEALRPTLFVPMTGSAEDNRKLKPDPDNPSLINGSFETDADDNGFAVGWYYQRQAQQVDGDDAPDGKRFMKFENTTPGRDCHLMQGLALDGRNVSRVRLRGWCRTGTTVATDQRSEGPRVVITFYDEHRRDLGQWWLGPWYANESWRHQQKDIVVPKRAREAIVRIGLFGATGTASFDNIELKRLNP